MKKSFYPFCLALVLFAILPAMTLPAQDERYALENFSSYDYKNNNWRLTYSIDYSYLGNGLVGKRIASYYDSNQVVSSQSSETYTYDSRENNILTLFMQKKPDAGWLNSSRSVSDYDANNKMILNDIQAWSQSMNDWDTTKFRRVIYFYNDRGLSSGLLRFMQYTTPEVKADSNEKRTLFYDDNDRKTRENIFSFKSGAWARQSEFTSKFNDIEKSKVVMFYSYSDDTVRTIEKSTVLSNDNGDDTSDVHQLSTDNGKSWSDRYKYIYQYDQNGNMTASHYFTRKDNSWQNFIKTEYSYDDSLMTEEVDFQWVDNAWAAISKKTYRYKLVSSSGSDNFSAEAPAAIQTFPNPAASAMNITIDLAFGGMVGCTIYDASGRLIEEIPVIYQPAGKYGITFDANNMPAGSYFIDFNINGKKQSRHVVISR